MPRHAPAPERGSHEHVVTFPGFPFRMRVAGVGSSELRHACDGSMLAAGEVARAAGTKNYTLRVSRRAPRATHARAGLGSPVTSFVRYRRGSDEDTVSVPGGRVRIRPGRPDAAASIRPDGDLRAVLEPAVSHALALQGLAVVHAAAFDAAGFGVLAVGSSFSGKSTFAAAALVAGARVISDDSVVVGRGVRGEPTVGALRRNLHLRDASVDVLPPSLRARVAPDPGAPGGRWCLPRAAAAERFVGAAPLRVIVDLRLDRRRRASFFGRASQAETLAAIIRSTSPLFLSARYGTERARLLPVLREAVAAAVCLRACIGRDLLASPAEVIGRLLEAAGLPADCRRGERSESSRVELTGDASLGGNRAETGLTL